MKIVASDVTLSSSHSVSQQREVRETLRAWVGDPPAPAARPAPLPTVQISEAARAAQANDAAAVGDDDTESDPKIQLIKTLLEFMTGQKITLMRPQDLSSPGGEGQAPAGPDEAGAPPAGAAGGRPLPPPRAGFGVEYERKETVSETEQTSFQASGVIRTADNQEVKFDISLQMRRSFQQERNDSLRLGDAAGKVDPLVLNFSGNAAELTEQRFAFDLDADGKTENIQFVKGSGFLALDRNQDGKINDGSELFGPATGNGFAELATLDSDRNGWIDENDPAYAQLQVWSRDEGGHEQLQSLTQANVGAMMTGSTVTPFQMKDAQNNAQAQVRSTGVWLTEQGKAGTVQQIDLVA